jgi:hypothetical protein
VLGQHFLDMLAKNVERNRIEPVRRIQGRAPAAYPQLAWSIILIWNPSG